jgi:hypothetical protein
MKLRLYATAALTAVAVASPATAAAQDTTPPASFFGMHYSPIADGSWPQAKVGSVRLWDAGTTWRDVNPARGVFVWDTLDAAVGNARTHGARVSLVLGLTPQWAAARPADAAYYGPGTGSPPAHLADWYAYVRAVVTRYSGRIDSYEVWNEPEAMGLFWTGTPAELATMARSAYRAVRSVDSAARLLSPGLVTRWGGMSRRWAREYAAAGGFRWADVLSIHPYPDAGGGPREAIAMTVGYQRFVAGLGAPLPVWITEVNYEANVDRPATLDAAEQARYLGQTYRQAWAAGVRRVTWYDWSSTTNLGVRAAAETGSPVPAKPGRRFTWVQHNW